MIKFSSPEYTEEMARIKCSKLNTMNDEFHRYGYTAKRNVHIMAGGEIQKKLEANAVQERI